MRFEDWGLIDYELAVQKQLERVGLVADSRADECVVFCSHPPVVTLGRGSQPDDLQGWSGSVVESSRGGRATYHGPNQLVIYPIIDLRQAHLALPPRDLHAYLRVLEQVVVRALHKLGLPSAEVRVTGAAPGEPSLTGVWVGPRKVASIGIAVRGWITYHGVAVNLSHDPLAHQGIRPCGFSANIMTSVESELGKPVDRDVALSIFRQVCDEAFCSS